MDNEGNTKKELIAEVFARASANYARITYFWPLGRRLVERVAISPGAQVLDVACGRGAILFPAAESVGPTGQVIGIDLSGPMAEQTNLEIQRRGLLNAQALHMDAENLEVPDESFDYVLCGFSLPFFPGLERALAEFRRVLKPGGCVAASTWGDDEDPRWTWYSDLCTAYGVGVKLRTQNLGTPNELRTAFQAAGFADIQVSTELFDQVYTDEEEWWMTQWSISGRATLEQLEPSALASFKQAAFEQMRVIKEPDGFHDMLQAHFALATKPASETL
jgi:ubiquinone/menaquinone biosynthesis C-methylase UbiE